MQATTKQTLKVFWQHSRKYSGLFWVDIFSIIAASTLQIFKPFLYKNFFNVLAAPNPDNALLLRIIINVLILSAGNWIFWRVATFVSSIIQARVMADLMNKCFSYLHKHSYGFFVNNFAGSLVRRVNKYSWSFEQITDQLFWALMPAAVSVTAICIVLFRQTKILGLVLFAWTVLYVTSIYYFSLYKLKFDIKRTEEDTKTTAILADTIPTTST
jgi:ATP-binding cassette subfamily B protein